MPGSWPRANPPLPIVYLAAAHPAGLGSQPPPTNTTLPSMAALQKKLLLSGLSLVFTLGAFELALRVAGYDPFGDAVRSGRQEPGELLAQGFLMESADEDLVYELVPGAEAWAWEADVAVNSHGFRDREYTLAKPVGVRRVVALGDSATFGIKLPVEVLWPERLEASYAPEDKVEVLNLGIVGYDILEEVAFLESRGLAFAPDLVVVGFHVNDLGYASPTRSYIQRLQNYGSPIYRARVLQFLRSHLDHIEIAREQERRSSEEYFASENAEKIVDVSDDPELTALLAEFRVRAAADDLAPGVNRYVSWFTSAPRIGKLRFALERLAGLAEDGDFQVLVFVVPWLGDVELEDAYDMAYGILGHEVERVGFEFLDPCAATRAAGHPELQIVTNDFGHPNAEGHAILGASVRERIDERDWIPARD